MKKFLIGLLITLVLFLFIFLLWIYKFFPFSTASSSPAFLGTTFEMSLPEIKRTLNKDHITLTNNLEIINKLLGQDILDYGLEDKHDVLQQNGLFAVFFDDTMFNDFSDTHLLKQRWYTFPIIMFESISVAEFILVDQKLVSTEILFFPLHPNTAAQVVNKIVTELNKKTTFLGKIPSTETPGAYSLKFKNNQSSFDLWVNLVSSPTSPDIILRINYIPYLNYPNNIMRKREISAF